jgi:hypothetical protein
MRSKGLKAPLIGPFCAQGYWKLGRGVFCHTCDTTHPIMNLGVLTIISQYAVEQRHSLHQINLYLRPGQNVKLSTWVPVLCLRAKLWQVNQRSKSIIQELKCRLHPISYYKITRKVAGLPPGRPWFDHRPDRVGFVMGQSGTGAGSFPQYFSSPLPVSFQRGSKHFWKRCTVLNFSFQITNQTHQLSKFILL